MRKFFLSIILPSFLAIALFVLAIYLIVLPSFEKNMMNRKKEMIRELTNTMWSLVQEYDRERVTGSFTLEEAKELAVKHIEGIRYGDENKDYFWIIDHQPVMIMHPYRKDLNGKDLSDYTDAKGKKLFVESRDLVKSQGEGFIDYYWQWKDDSSQVVPKLSFVKEYESWGWIIGTGIYLEDVRLEIINLEKNLIRASFIIFFIILAILLFIIRQSLLIENKRKQAESRLSLSRLKYKSLVEASTEGTLMIINSRIIFANARLKALLGDPALDLSSLNFNDLFRVPWEDMQKMLIDPGKSVSVETELLNQGISIMEVVISLSSVDYSGEKGYILVVKEPGVLKRLEIESQRLSDDLQESLLLMNQPVRPFIREITSCELESSLQQAAKKMSSAEKDIIFVRAGGKILGTLTDKDIRSRALAEGAEKDAVVTGFMTAPVRYIDSDLIVSEALLAFEKGKTNYLGVKNEDGVCVGYVDKNEILSAQQNLVSKLITEIGSLSSTAGMARIRDKMLVLVKSLMDSGGKINHLTRIVTLVSDTLTRQIIKLALQEKGKPPGRFCFLVMGSEGRGEQSFATDQDNAIIYECHVKADSKATKNWFLSFAEKVNYDLNAAGYRFCDGEVMARNQRWTAEPDEWKLLFKDWIINADPQNILDATIFFDFRPVYGAEDLARNLRGEVNRLLEEGGVFFHQMARTVQKFKPPLGMLGGIVPQQDADGKIIDIKKILMPVLGYIRLIALKNGITECNSLERLEKLISLAVLNNTQYNELREAYMILMNLRFRFQLEQVLKNQPVNNDVDLNRLNDVERSILKKIFSIIANMQSQLGMEFRI